MHSSKLENYVVTVMSVDRLPEQVLHCGHHLRKGDGDVPWRDDDRASTEGCCVVSCPM